MGASGIVSALGGAEVANSIDDRLSNVLFAILLVIVSAKLIRDLVVERRA